MNNKTFEHFAHSAATSMAGRMTDEMYYNLRTGAFVRKELDDYSVGEYTGAYTLTKTIEWVDEDPRRVVVHSFFAPKCEEWRSPPQHEWTSTFFPEVPNCRRTRKSMNLATLLVEAGIDPTDADIVVRDWAAKMSSVKLEMKCFHGTDIVDQYREMENWSTSCMTGHRSKYTELYAGNPSQIALAVLYNDGLPYARVMLFKPIHDKKVTLSDEIPAEIGAGWKYIRIYSRGMSMGCCDDQTTLAHVRNHLDKLGVKHWYDTPTGWVHVRKGPNNWTPYLDGDLELVHQGNTACIYMGENPHPYWDSAYAHATDPYGSGFDDSDVRCAHCGESYNSEDDESGYINDVGDCCPCCYRDSVYCEFEDISVLSDNAIEVRSRCGNYHGYASREFDSYRRTSFVLAETKDGDEVFVPEQEAVSTGDGHLWWDTGDDEPVHITKKLTVVGTGMDMWFGFVEVDEWSWTATTVTMRDGEEELVSIDHRLTNRCHIQPTIKWDEGTGRIRLFLGSDEMTLATLYFNKPEWAVIDGNWKVRGCNTWSYPDNLDGVRRYISWSSQSMYASHECFYSPLVMSEITAKAVDSSYCAPSMTSINRLEEMLEDSGSLGMLNRIEQAYPGTATTGWMESHTLRMMGFAKKRLIGTVRYSSSGDLYFIVSSDNMVVAAYDWHGRRMIEMTVPVYPGAADFERATKKFYQKKANGETPTAEMIQHWLTNGDA
jgi:hypothetical protein